MAFQLNVRKLKAITGQLFSSASIITDRFPSGKSQSLYPFTWSAQGMLTYSLFKMLVTAITQKFLLKKICCFEQFS